MSMSISSGKSKQNQVAISDGQLRNDPYLEVRNSGGTAQEHVRDESIAEVIGHMDSEIMEKGKRAMNSFESQPSIALTEKSDNRNGNYSANIVPPALNDNSRTSDTARDHQRDDKIKVVFSSTKQD